MISCPAFRSRAIGVASARIQVHDFQMDRPIGFTEEVVQDLSISLLRFAFATEKDRRSLGDDRAASRHPICGTAP
jgi:hypothetical protein